MSSESSWYGAMIENMRALIERNSVLEAPSNPIKTMPIYRCNRPELVCNPAAGTTDLEAILFNLLKSNLDDKFQQRLWLIFTYLADARGGEAKFLNYGDWLWDEHLEVLECTW